MAGLTKLYVGNTQTDLGNEWTYSTNSWEAMTKLSLIHFDELRIERDFCCSIGLTLITTSDILVWLKTQSFSVGELNIV